jgi:hypothetical protein
MTRTVVLTALIVLGIAVGGYALWSSTSNAGEVVAEPCGGAVATGCGSEMDAGCAGCPSAVAVAVEEPACAHGDDCPCGGDPAACTDEMKAACDKDCVQPAQEEAKAACGTAEGEACGGRCKLSGTAPDAS